MHPAKSATLLLTLELDRIGTLIMNKEVYRYLFQTYGRNWAQWFGFAAEFVRTFVMRVYIAIAMAQVTAAIARGDSEAAKRHTLYFFVRILGVRSSELLES